MRTVTCLICHKEFTTKNPVSITCSPKCSLKRQEVGGHIVKELKRTGLSLGEYQDALDSGILE